MREIARKTIVLAFSNFVTRGLGMLFFVLLAKALTVSEYSLFRYLITLASMFGLAFYGIPTALAKYLSQPDTDNRSRSEYLGATIALLGIIYAILILTVLIFNDNKFYLIIFIFAYLIDLFYLGFSRGLLDYLKLNAYKLIANSLQFLILGGLFLINGKIDFAFGVIFYAFSGVISLLVFEIIRWQMKASFSNFKNRFYGVVKFSVPVTFGGIGWTVLLGITSIYLEKYIDIDQVGYYSVGVTLMQTFSFLPDAIFTLLMPKISGLNDKTRIIKPLRLAFYSCLLVTILIFLPLYFYRSLIITFVFSEKYLAASIIILPLAIGQLFIILNQIYGTALQGLGNPKVPSIIIAIAAGINVILGYIFVRKFGLIGAAYSFAIAGLASYILMAAYWFRFVRRGGLT